MDNPLATNLRSLGSLTMIKEIAGKVFLYVVSAHQNEIKMILPRINYIGIFAGQLAY